MKCPIHLEVQFGDIGRLIRADCHDVVRPMKFPSTMMWCRARATDYGAKGLWVEWDLWKAVLIDVEASRKQVNTAILWLRRFLASRRASGFLRKADC